MASYQQDPFLKNKQKKLFASRTWPPEFSEKVDVSRVSIDVLRTWIERRVAQLLGNEDEIVSEYCVAQLEAFDPVDKTIEPREVQINLEGFLGEDGAAVLMRELWTLMLAAQLDPAGVPPQLLEQQRQEKEALRKQEEELQERIARERAAVKDEKEKVEPRRERRRSDSRERDHRRRRSRSGGRRRRSPYRRSPSRDRYRR